MNNAVTAYCKQVRRRLACVPQMRAHTLPQLEDALLDYTAEHPQADFAALCARFGTPGQFAENTLANMDGAQLARQMNRYRWRRVLLAAVVTLVFGCTLYHIARFAIQYYRVPIYVLVTPEQAANSHYELSEFPETMPNEYSIVGPAVEIEGPMPTNQPIPNA